MTSQLQLILELLRPPLAGEMCQRTCHLVPTFCFLTVIWYPLSVILTYVSSLEFLRKVQYLRHSIERHLNAQERGGILHGLIIYVCPGEAGVNGLPSKEGYRVLVEACGATLLQNATQLSKQDASKVVMIVNNTQSLGTKARLFLSNGPMVMHGREFMNALLEQQFEFTPFVSEHLKTVFEVDDDETADNKDGDVDYDSADDDDRKLVDESSDTFQTFFIRSVLLVFATTQFNASRAAGTPIQIMKNITPKDYDSIDGLKQFNADVVTDALANPEKWMGYTYESMVKVRDISR